MVFGIFKSHFCHYQVFHTIRRIRSFHRTVSKIFYKETIITSAATTNLEVPDTIAASTQAILSLSQLLLCPTRQTSVYTRTAGSAGPNFRSRAKESVLWIYTAAAARELGYRSNWIRRRCVYTLALSLSPSISICIYIEASRPFAFSARPR